MNGRQITNKQWPHAPEALLRGRLVYLVKFYGDQEVQQAKGTEPIKEAVRKMKFNKQLRKAEGQKVTPKVELCINVDGLSIQDPKTKVQQYKFPLHHISYCADDKTEKKLFTFIAKDGTTGKHLCFVLGSEKNAEEITLTIGQAFDLAYKRFLEKKENQQGQRNQFALLQQQVEQLQKENEKLKKRIAELEAEKTYNSALNKPLLTDSSVPLTTQTTFKQTTNLDFLFNDDFTTVNGANSLTSTSAVTNGNTTTTAQSSSESLVKIAPPPTTKTSPRSSTNQQAPVITQAAISSALPATTQASSMDSTDAFGMTIFNPGELAEMERGFKGGELAIGIEEFDLNSLDPLK